MNGTSPTVELLVIVENNSDSELQAEHGLAVLVRGPGRQVLFDAGASQHALLANAEKLGVCWDNLDATIVSHGHYDHTGGLAAIARPGRTLFASPLAFNRRWSEHRGKPMREISCPHDLKALCRAGLTFRPVTGPEMIEPWLVLSGPVGGPPVGQGDFIVMHDSQMIEDHFADELFALIRTSGGWAVLTGCCHRGLANTLRYARFLARGEPITAIIGGLHLHDASPEELQATVELLQSMGSPMLHPCHCTGPKAIEHLCRALPGRVEPLIAGSRLSL